MRTWTSSLDRATRLFWRITGRPVDLAGSEPWLDAPMHDRSVVGEDWLLPHDHADADETGLLADMSELDGPDFRAADLHPDVRDFYERTSRWRMEVWTQWNPVFQPGGEVVSRLFGRRVQQLALPTRPLDVARGMDSKVVPVLDPGGTRRAAAWIRTLRSTGEYVYSGHYATRTLPGRRSPSVHVAFPLESGNVQVFLRPVALPGGGLELRSPAGAFGQDGAYAVVADGGRTFAARIPIHETFHVFVDNEGTLRTDHALHLWSAPVVRLHYKLVRAG
ncbi:hypothetical protein REH65_09510 [Saccharopolyspora sp. ID03-671]|uniref:hypothetical protein n=1 Tax=Saccharopolyspora sp. ID03-671 TaxID=3073066 RepID=UPI0032446682